MKKILVISLILSFLAFLPKASTVVGSSTEFLTSSWALSANNGAAEKSQIINPNILQGQDTLRLTYNLHGLNLLGGDASAIIFDQPNGSWHYISLSNYGKNGFDGQQTVNIPLSNFPGLNTSSPVGTFHVRFWYPSAFTIDINSVTVSGQGTTSPTPITLPTPTSFPTPTPSTAPINMSWSIQSIDAMKQTKDVICGQRSEDWINQWVAKAQELGANYVAISTPYENPSCGDASNYTKMWINAIRAKGLKVWHRQMPLAFEGIYNVPKNNSSNFLSLISNYIKSNAANYQDGDIFTPIPEPQNGGISGVTYCAQGVCQFSNAQNFNQWLRDAMTTANKAFRSIGKNNMKIGYFGFDGFTAWGDNNPDWHGILEDATIKQMGNITIDHYPEIVGDTMSNDLNELQTRYPNVPIVIGEWGTITTATDPVSQVKNSMGAAKRPGVIGFNYWQFGPGGAGEQMINDDFSNRSQFSTVQSFYKGN